MNYLESTKMNRCIYDLIIIFCLGIGAVPSQGQEIKFSFQDGLQNKPQLKNRISAEISKLLSEIQSAYRANRNLNLSQINMTDDARNSLTALWNNYAHFSIDDNEIVTKCLRSYSSYEVRQIYTTFHRDDNQESRELTIGFTDDYMLTFVRPALEMHNTESILYDGNEVSDTRERLEILNFVERFRNFYNEKNLTALQDIYSDDALIITAKVVGRQKMDDQGATLRPDVIYEKKTKDEYIKNLENVFKRNKYLHIDFDNVMVLKHPARAHFYGVTLHQKWDSSNYKDDGYVFLLWEFPEDDDPEKHPMVHVRTWQPDEIIRSGLKQINVNDFIISSKK